VTFLEPLAQLSPIPLPGLTDQSDTAAPIIQQLPQTQAAFGRKYSNPETISALKAVPKNVRRSLIELDHQRALKGQYPLSTEQTALSLVAAVKHKPVTKKKETSPWNPLDFLNNARKDIQSLVTEIPKLPITAVNEAYALTHIGDEIEKVDTLGDVAMLPGIRLLPGAFVAGGLLPGGVPAGELVRHPVMAGLDVLPFANKALGTGAGQTLRANVADTAVARTVKAGARDLASSRVGQATRRAVGQQSRGDARAFSNENLAIAEEIAPSVEVKLGARTKTMPNPLEPETGVGRIAREGQLLDLDFQKRGLTPEDIVSTTERMQRGDYSGMTDLQTEYVSRARELTEQTAREANTMLPPDEAVQKVGPRGERVEPTAEGEWFDPKTAAKIFKARTKADKAKALAGIHQRMGTPLEGAEIGMLGTEIRRALSPQELKTTSAARLAEGYAHNLDAAGIEASHLFDAVKKYRAKEIDRGTLIQAFEDTTANPFTRAQAPMDQTAILESLPRTRDPQIVKLRDAVESGRFRDAAKLARALTRRTKFEVPNIAEALDDLSRKAAQSRYVERTGRAEKVASTLEARAQKVTSRSAPARFVPELSTRATNEYAVRLSDGTPENIAQVSRQIVARDFDNIPGFNELEYRALQREIEGTWKQLKDDGFDPVFVHAVPRGGVNAILYPKITPRITTPGAMKQRTMDWSPTPGSAGVAITHEATQLLGRRGAENFLNNRAEILGKSRADLDSMYRATAERRAGGDPRLVPGELDRLVNRDYGKLDFKGLGISRNTKIAGKFGDTDIYIPKNTLKNLDDFMKTAKSPIAAAIDPVMNVFRTAVLPLSPRWQFYNLLGGAMATTAENPFAFRHLPRAYKSIREGHVNIKSDVFRRKVSHSQQLAQEWNHSAGKTGGRIMDEVNAARAAGKVTSPVRKAFGKAVKWSFDRNEFVDQMFRTMNYMEAEGRALKKGATATKAASLGEESARKVLADWTELTPVERTVMRYMAPFYSFMQHITRYALRYPMEHPWRTAVLGAFARAEEEDFGTGLPERFLNGFFLGEPDENGNVTQIKLDGLNPFRDVADNFTLAGLLGQTNPIIQTLAEQVGIDTMAGGPELYPTLRYDSMTGRLAARNDNPLTAFLSNTIPQVELLRSLTGTSQEFKELARSNPEAALNLLRSQAGFPVLTKTVNVPQEEMKNELALQENQKKVLSEALRSGNYTEAEQYPALRPYISQVQALSAEGKLEDFQLATPTPAGLSLARRLIPIG
jgi:hypothetical protein